VGYGMVASVLYGRNPGIVRIHVVIP